MVQSRQFDVDAIISTGKAEWAGGVGLADGVRRGRGDSNFLPKVMILLVL